MNGSGSSFRAWVPIAVAALGSTLLFYSGVFSYLFAVPVQVVFARHGLIRGYVSAATTGLVVLVGTLVQAARLPPLAADLPRIVILQVLTPLALLAAVALFNGARRIRWWARLVLSGALATAGALPGLMVLDAAVAGEDPFASQLEGMLRMAGVVDDPMRIIEQVRRIVVTGIGVGMTAAVAATWWLGSNLVARRRGGMISLRTARVADELVWVVIFGLAIVVADWIGNAGALGPIGWNAALVGAFLFGIQGLAIAQHLVWRRGGAPVAERWILTGILIALLVPVLNVAVVVALPLFGISELWINYGRRRINEGNSE